MHFTHDPSIWILPAMVAALEANKANSTYLASVTFHDSFSRSEPTGSFAIVDLTGSKEEGEHWVLACEIGIWELAVRAGSPTEAVEILSTVERSRPSEAAHLVNSELAAIATTASGDLTGYDFTIQPGIFDISYDWEPGPEDDVELIQRVSFSIRVNVVAE